MKLIWKYPLDLVGEQTLLVPVLAKPLTTQMQDGTICIWFEVQQHYKESRHPRKVHVVGTGHAEIQEDWLYAGTVQDGFFVWHIYVEPDN